MGNTLGPGIGDQLRRFLSTNSTATAYTTSIGLAGSLPSGWVSANSHIGMFPIQFYGTGASGTTYKARLLGAWAVDNAGTIEYDVGIIAEFEVTLGTVTGAADRLVTASERFPSAVTVTNGEIAAAYTPAAPSAGTANSRTVVRIEDMGQPDFIGFEFDMDAGSGTSATNGNVLFRFIS
jgi:hypothetical protein